VPELGVFCSDSYIAGRCDFIAAGNAITVDGSDGWLPDFHIPGDAAESGPIPGKLSGFLYRFPGNRDRAIHHLFEILTSTRCFVSGTGQYGNIELGFFLKSCHISFITIPVSELVQFITLGRLMVTWAMCLFFSYRTVDM
jgi:hypothetical protein